ncbi:MAG TPA: choice-of-anchor O protein, partial [Gammaproteobacteria bacterium]
MSRKRKLIGVAVAAALAGGGLLATSAFAAVGEQVNKSMSQTINLPAEIPAGTPEADHVFIKYLRFYVPAQTASGEPADTDEDGTLGVSYYDIDGVDVKERDGAKPMISAFMYGPVTELDTSADTEANAGGFAGNGFRDAYGAISLDDGHTWKQTNLSDSASAPVDGDGFTYPSGDVNNIVHATAGNKVVVAWQSRSCSQGSPAYTLSDNTGALTEEGAAVASYLGITTGTDLYLDDVFGVAGSQGSVDYVALGYPSVGLVPFNCLWTARGVLLTDDDSTGDVNEGDDPRTADVTESSHIVWYNAERLTSGRRDVNRVEIQMVAGAGAAITWQEDPEGLLPGSGEGPGEGWSGAIANNQTDTWYSFLPWEHFEAVQNDADIATPYDALTDYWVTVDTTKPKAYVPFAVPMRLTNNARCNATVLDDPTTDDAYCGITAVNYGLKNQCVDTTDIPQGPQGTLNPICVSEDGLPNVANTAATRARLSLQPRDTDGDGVTDSAWAVVVAEESKGMGRFFFKTGESGATTATPCTEGEEECEEADIGKNIWYYSFDMGKPQTSADTSETGLVANLVNQGNLINQPEVDWRTGEFFPPMSTADMWDFGDYNFDIYRTEIARRGSLMVQPVGNVVTDVGPGRDLTALLLYKQGLMNQGGPADIMARRLVNAGVRGNPYDFGNLVCEETIFTDGSNPYYPQGICMSPAINISGTTPQTCDVGGGGDNDVSDGTCPTIDGTGIASDDPTDQQTFDKLTTWIQCPGSPLCGSTDLSTALGSNLDDQSWYNPLDVAKGHRGYLWGNMAVVMYAWSPNWKLNAKGSDRYELYIRRSFDGGQTWTTTPADWGGVGTQTCETMRDGDTASTQSQVCTTYAAGADEQARNVSQIRSQELLTPTNKYTVLDPRYAPDPPTMPTIEDATYADPDSDVFNPSRFFVVFETGDNTTVEFGEAEPLDLNYGRAINFGDYYQVTSDEVDLIGACSAAFCNEFDRLNVGGDTTASEASLAMTPAGDTLYSVWAQEGGVNLHDAQYARVWYDDPNTFTMPTQTPITGEEPVIGGGGGDTYVPP